MKIYKKSKTVSASYDIYADSTTSHDYLEELKDACGKISNHIVNVDYFDDDLNSYVVIYDKPARSDYAWKRKKTLISGLERYGISAKYISSMENLKMVEIAIADADTVESSSNISASSKSDNFVFYYNRKCMYSGDGTGFARVIEKLCKNEKVNAALQDWCNQFGDPFDFDGTPIDTASVFAQLIEQDFHEQQDDFYVDGSGTGINFECFPESQESVNSASASAKKSVTASTSADDIYADDIESILNDAGFFPVYVEKTRTHLGTEFIVNYDTDEHELNDLLFTLENNGYTATVDETTPDGVLLFLEQVDSTPKYLYQVSFGSWVETVEMDDETSDYQEIVDTLIDQLESEGSEGCFVPDNEIDTYPEDEYVVGGNHGRALITNGILDIQPIGWSNDVQASTDIVTM